MLKILIKKKKNNLIDIKLSLLIFSKLIFSSIILWSITNKNIYIIKKKIFQIIIGTISLIIFSNISINSYKIISNYAYIICLLLLTLVNIIGYANKGAKRWINIKNISFQPSEITKISIPFVLNNYINNIDKKKIKIKKIIIITLIIITPSFLIGIQPNLGTSILIILSGISTLFFLRIKIKNILNIITIILAIIIIILCIFIKKYQINRIKTFLNLKKDYFNKSYHIIQSKITLGSGGIIGKGWMKGSQSRLNFLPETHTDFILSSIGEEFGFIGILTILILYILIIIRCIIISINNKNIFFSIIINNYVLIFSMYIFINIGMITGILPIVGIPLPLISYGGSSLICTMINFGIIISIKNDNNKYKIFKNNNNINNILIKIIKKK